MSCFTICVNVFFARLPVKIETTLSFRSQLLMKTVLIFAPHGENSLAEAGQGPNQVVGVIDNLYR